MGAFRTRLVAITWVFMILFGCASDPVAPRASTVPAVDEPPGREDDHELADLIKLHNQERSEAGLPPLAFNAELAAAAQRHARDMAKHESLSHKGSDGSTPSERIAATGYHARRTGENIADGQETPAEVMKSWINSPRHKANILGDFRELGAAVAESAGGTRYWAVDFGSPWPKLDPAEAAGRVLERMNRVRAAEGRQALRTDPRLESAAAAEARLMAAEHTLRPKRAGQPTAFQRVEQAGYRFRRLAENVASGRATADDLVKSWTEDRGQKQNVIGGFSQVGIGYATAADGTPYWCVLFAQPAGSP